MDQNLSEIRYDVTKKTKLRKFYESNKKIIFLFVGLFIITIASVSFYLDSKEKKKFFYQKIS